MGQRNERSDPPPHRVRRVGSPRTVCTTLSLQSPYPCTPSPNHPFSELLQPLLGPSPRPAHSAGPRLPAAHGPLFGSHFRLKTVPLSLTSFPSAAKASRRPLREPTGPVLKALRAPLGLLLSVLRATLCRPGGLYTSLPVKCTTKLEEAKNLVKHIGF